MDILIIGPSLKNIKVLNVSKRFLDGTYIINKHNWVGSDQYNDMFEVKIIEGICYVKRLDSDSGWGMMLGFEAPVQTMITNEIIPVYFINLDKDVERLQSFEEMIYPIFGKEHVLRIPGVVHELGLEGCRLAHIDANITAINHGYDYYIICEDDIKPLVNNDIISEYVKKATAKNIDLVLLEYDIPIRNGKLDDNVKMHKSTENLYRFYNGGYNTGCYLSKRGFGAALIKIWMRHPESHVDGIWKLIFPDYRVFLHKPQIFNQKAGPSNQSDVEWRCERPLFDWQFYEDVISCQKK